MFEEVPFESLFAVPLRNGVSYPSRTRGEGIPMINMAEIFAYDRIGSPDCELVPITERERATSVLEDGDLLFARQSLTFEGAGKCSLVLPSEGDRTWDSHLIRVRLDPDQAVPAFFYYYFRSVIGRRSIETIVQQVAAAGIRGSDLRRLSVPLPDTKTQRAIAEVLGALDDKIAANRQVVQRLFELSVANYERTRSRVSQMSPLSELVTTQYGVTTSGVEGHSPRLIRVTDMNKGPWIEWAKAPGCEIDSDSYEKYRLRSGDILVARMADPGKVAYVDDDVHAVFASYLIRLVANDSRAQLYLYYFLQSAEYARYANSVMGGSVQKNINAKKLVNTDAPVPPPDQLMAFSASVVPLRRAMTAHLKENEELAKTRDGLLPLLMSGKLRVKDAEKTIGEVV